MSGTGTARGCEVLGRPWAVTACSYIPSMPLLGSRLIKGRAKLFQLPHCSRKHQLSRPRPIQEASTVGFCSSADDTEPETCRQYSLMILRAGLPLIAISLRTKISPTIPVLIPEYDEGTGQCQIENEEKADSKRKAMDDILYAT